MAIETPKDNWIEIKGRIRDRFGKLTEESVESLKGNLDLLAIKLQTTYGYAKEQANKELAVFKLYLDKVIEPEKPLVKVPVLRRIK
jgi:uncharacterized protein YjbJ (UPF0337 family)